MSDSKDLESLKPSLPVQSSGLKGVLAGIIDDTLVLSKGLLKKGSTRVKKKEWGDGQYSGGWVEGKPHGKGKLACPEGKVYEGEWVEGKRHGKGRYAWPDGNVYKGDYVEDKRHGAGIHTYASGDFYEGGYVDDKCHGKGKGKRTLTDG